MTYRASRYPFGYWPFKEWEHRMPRIDVTSPVSSAPTDRLALGVGWVRPGVAGIGGTLNPTLFGTFYVSFESTEE